MDNLLEAAREAFSDVINLLNERYNVYCKASGMEFRKLPWKARAMTYQELYEDVKAERGDALDRTVEKLKAELLKDRSHR